MYDAVAFARIRVFRAIARVVKIGRGQRDIHEMPPRGLLMWLSEVIRPTGDGRQGRSSSEKTAQFIRRGRG
jgi:hypothetical protein